MYFDPRPKTKREDLFDRERELEEFITALESRRPLTVITGIRRLGKTSLLLVGLNEANAPYILVDMRDVNPSSEFDLYKRIEAGLNRLIRERKDIKTKIKEILSHISGIQILGSGIYLSWGERGVDLLELFETLERLDVVIAFDEVQYAKGPIGRKLTGLIAHLYDYTDLRIVVTGSEVGLLYDFLGIEDPNAPLFGRYFEEITLSRFSEEQGREFLRIGFEQCNINVGKETIEEAVRALDGIVGWLVLFGISALKNPERALEATLKKATLLAKSEFEEFLGRHEFARKRYIAVMRAVALGNKRWSEIKEFLERREKKSISDSVVHRLLTNLVKSSFLEKVKGEYRIADPILEMVFKQGF
ncbi:AAA family ATPase [Pyrococcus kukulkanii]|uniref:AAA family ATPase n=1 Tax=Pyrococcus kukulkanii TaxID=1609559 RepID=UPI003564633C